MSQEVTKMKSLIGAIVFMVIFLWSWKELDTADDNYRPALYVEMILSGFSCLFWVLHLGGVF